MHACMHAVGMLVWCSCGSQLRPPAQQADDLALAKAMQEQERAFHWLGTQAARPDEWPGAT